MGKIKITGNYLLCSVRGTNCAFSSLVKHKICGMCRRWGARGVRKNSFDNWTIDCDWGASQIGPTMDRIAFVYPTNSGETNRAKIDRVKKSNCRAGQSKSGRNKRFAQLRKAQYREPPKKPQESRRVRVQCNRSTRWKLTTGRGGVWKMKCSCQIVYIQ